MDPKVFRSSPICAILLLVAAGLLSSAAVRARTPNETLLTPDNAYNPIPSPDGEYVAYVRTGWGEGIWIGLGRASLVSDVKLINTEGAPNPKVLAKNFFLSGWTPDGTRVVCYRDWNYALVSTEGEQQLKGRIPNDPNHIENVADWVAYSPSSGTVLWSRVINESQRVIETPDHVVAHQPAFWHGLWKERRSEEHTSELQSQFHLVCRLLLEKKKKTKNKYIIY